MDDQYMMDMDDEIDFDWRPEELPDERRAITAETAFWPEIVRQLQQREIEWEDIQLDCTICYEPMVYNGMSSRHAETPIILPCGHIFGDRCYDDHLASPQQQEAWRAYWVEYGIIHEDSNYIRLTPTPLCPTCRHRLTFVCEQVVCPVNRARWIHHTCTAFRYTWPRDVSELWTIPSPVPHQPNSTVMNRSCMRCRLTELVDHMGNWLRYFGLRVAIRSMAPEEWEHLGNPTLEHDGFARRLPEYYPEVGEYHPELGTDLERQHMNHRLDIAEGLWEGWATTFMQNVPNVPFRLQQPHLWDPMVGRLDHLQVSFFFVVDGTDLSMRMPLSIFLESHGGTFDYSVP